MLNIMLMMMLVMMLSIMMMMVMVTMMMMIVTKRKTRAADTSRPKEGRCRTDDAGDVPASGCSKEGRAQMMLLMSELLSASREGAAGMLSAMLRLAAPSCSHKHYAATLHS